MPHRLRVPEKYATSGPNTMITGTSPSIVVGAVGSGPVMEKLDHGTMAILVKEKENIGSD